MTEAEFIAREFHRIYTHLAPAFGWRVHRDTRDSWEELPDRNRKLMIATAGRLIADGTIIPGHEAKHAS